MTEFRECLRRTRDAEKIGGLEEVHRLCDPVPDVTAIERHAAGIIETANLRKIIGLSNSAMDRAMKSDSADDILAELDTGIATIRPCGPDPVKDVFDLGLSEGPPRRHQFVLEDLIPAGWWTSLYAKTGSAKSFLALYIALHIVLGRPIFAKPVQQGSVLYLDAELDQQTFESRAWMIGIHWKTRWCHRDDAFAVQASPVTLSTEDAYDDQPAVAGMEASGVILITRSP